MILPKVVYFFKTMYLLLVVLGLGSSAQALVALMQPTVEFSLRWLLFQGTGSRAHGRQ